MPAEYDRCNGPHIAGRAQIGRISIANSDSEAYAYVDGAIDAAYRAINEQLHGVTLITDVSIDQLRLIV